jgi:hypothetical protein
MTVRRHDTWQLERFAQMKGARHYFEKESQDAMADYEAACATLNVIEDAVRAYHADADVAALVDAVDGALG